jgi:hypothetical protein
VGLKVIADPIRLIRFVTLQQSQSVQCMLEDLGYRTSYVNTEEWLNENGESSGGVFILVIGNAAARAAFFQEQVELTGLDSSGSRQAGLRAAGAPEQIRTPLRITNLDDLALRCGVGRSVKKSNYPPSYAVLPCCRQHIVVAGENPVEIAMQNGLSETKLIRANPDLSVTDTNRIWPVLITGQRILMSVH